MKKIELKKPRYALPLLCLPFIFLLFYVYQTGFKPENTQNAQVDSLQTGIAGVSREVETGKITNKLDAYRKTVRDADGYTAIGSITEDVQEKSASPIQYNQEEKRLLDSIDAALKNKYASPKSQNVRPAAAVTNTRSSVNTQDRDLAIALAKIQSSRTADANSISKPNKEMDAMSLFRAQMSLVDSMSKANDPEVKAARKRALKNAEQTKQENNVFSVRKSGALQADFNTIMAEKNQRPISAVVDQDITGYAGSRLRLRLLDDIVVASSPIPKGTYLYATISGFTAQRVNLKVSSLLVKGEVLPVDVQIYDYDGLPGIYVPSSVFRDFTRDVGGSGAQGITLQSQAGNNSQLVMGMVSRMFQSTTTAVSKLIRSNKAKLKFNSLVYLVDNESFRNKK